MFHFLMTWHWARDGRDLTGRSWEYHGISFGYLIWVSWENGDVSWDMVSPFHLHQQEWRQKPDAVVPKVPFKVPRCDPQTNLWKLKHKISMHFWGSLETQEKKPYAVTVLTMFFELIKTVFFFRGKENTWYFFGVWPSIQQWESWWLAKPCIWVDRPVLPWKICAFFDGKKT